MPSFVPPIPQANRSGAAFKAAAYGAEPAFNAPVRWTLRVLSWLAFAVVSYLAWHALNQTSVAGCTVGSKTGCDLVLSSSWSMWLGVPVSIIGLPVYATLAALSVLLGFGGATANRWITTAFVMFSIVAAAASIWFIGIQAFVIGSFCPYCLVTDVCGLAIGIVAPVFAVLAAFAERGAQPRAMQPGLIGLRASLPAGTRTAAPTLRTERSSPSLILALVSAVLLVSLLIGGQILFPSNTFGLEKVALTKSIEMNGSKTGDPESPRPAGETHVAMRVPNETDNIERPADSAKTVEDSPPDAHAEQTASDASPPPGEPAPPAKQRLVKFLGGKLTLDVYQHPIIGSPEAPHIAIEMVSYDCSHCRKMVPTIHNALERYGDQVALLVLLQPLDKECNKLVTDPAASHQGACTIARLGMGVAKLNPSSFATFHEFLMSGDKEKPPAIDAIFPKAYVLADRSRLREIIKSDELKKQLDGYIDLYDLLQKQNQGNKKFGLPIQILGDFVMTGSVEKEEDLFKAWEQHLGVKPQWTKCGFARLIGQRLRSFFQ